MFMTHSWNRQFPVYLKSTLECLFVFSRVGNQGDQKIGGKFAQFLDEVAKTVAKPKKCQNISKLNLKVKIYTKPFLTLNIPKSKPYLSPEIHLGL
jgi:hypothetical protein